MDTIIEVTTTLASREQAQRLASHLIEARLAACAQLTGPIRSLYRWEGKVCTEEEFRVTLKSTRALANKLTKAIQSQHPYDLPEVLVTQVEASQAYHDWIHSEVEEPR